jgi:membrane protease YdiL (CAAX protease family)
VLQQIETDNEVERHDRMTEAERQADGNGGPGNEDGYEPAPIPFPLIVVLEAALAPLALVLGQFVDQHPLSQFRWSLDALSRGLLATLPMLALLGITLHWPFGPLRRIKDFFENELRPALSGARWHDLALLSISAGLGEEMLFRGVIQGTAIGWMGPTAGLIAASLLFGLLHPVSPGYVLLASLIGAYLGLILSFDGNLLTVMIAHASYDFIAMSLLLRNRGVDSPTPGEEGPHD